MLSFYVILAHHPRPLFSHLPAIAFLAEPSNLQMRFLYPGRIFRTFQRSKALLPTKHYSLTYPYPVGVSAHYCLKSFSCNTYESPRKCCKQKTYGLAKPFRCNTYKKQGVGGSRERIILLTAQLSIVDCQPPLLRSSTDHGARITTNDSPLVVSYA